jgi:hypothetical protein
MQAARLSYATDTRFIAIFLDAVAGKSPLKQRAKENLIVGVFDASPGRMDLSYGFFSRSQSGVNRHRRACCRPDRVAFDPDVWSGRALQEVFVDLVVSGLASMYPVSSWSCCAPDHHGYQRACVLISGQASTGHSGHQCSHAPGRPILHLFLFLSQTSAGNC